MILSIMKQEAAAVHEGVVNIFVPSLCFIVLGSSSANSSPELTRKDYGIYCKCDCAGCLCA